MKNKLLENEKMFADANTTMAKATSSLTDFPKDFVLELYCECANKACNERVSIAFDEYREIKNVSDGEHFVVKPEHLLPEFERVLQKKVNYWVIQKKLEKLGKPFKT